MAPARERRAVAATARRVGRVIGRAAPASAAASLCLAASLAAQAPPSFTVRTEPAPLVRGTVGVITVHPAAGTDLASLKGRAADEPLHFEPAAGGGFTALIGVPIEGPDTFPVTLFAGDPEGHDSATLMLDVAEGSYRRERLSVAPKYARPDSAARQRILDEIAMARALSERAHDTPRLWSAAFRAPRSGRVTSPFGTARVLNGAVQSRHLGTDFSGAVGAPVRAANAGVVALVGHFYLAGNVVYVDHGEGLVTGYFHLSRVEVAQGDTVARGQIIGRVGRSGRVTGPHLHWIARYGRITVDPMSLLRLRDVVGGER
jgi:murein DD-endopeptidase MepM/ murein hydrolase activator NlpD